MLESLASNYKLADRIVVMKEIEKNPMTLAHSLCSGWSRYLIARRERPLRGRHFDAVSAWYC